MEVVGAEGMLWRSRALLPLNTLWEKYSTERSRLLQTRHPFKLIGVI